MYPVEACNTSSDAPSSRLKVRRELPSVVGIVDLSSRGIIEEGVWGIGPRATMLTRNRIIISIAFDICCEMPGKLPTDVIRKTKVFVGTLLQWPDDVASFWT